jgi:TonB family protein
MKKTGLFTAILLGILLWPGLTALRAADRIVLESHFFRASTVDGSAPPGPAVIVTSFSDPVFLPAPPASYAAEADLTYVSALKTELTGIYRLSQVDYITSGRIVWDGEKSVLNEAIVLDGKLYSIFYYPGQLVGSKVALRIEAVRHSGHKMLSQYRETWDGQKRIVSLTESEKIESAWGPGEKILNNEIETRLDESVVFGFPVNGHAFFLSLQARKSEGTAGQEIGRKAAPNEAPPMVADAYVPPKPRFQVTPLYPESCIQKGIEGLVTLFVETDEAGRVRSARVWQKAHPDLDKNALEALRKWTFDPIPGENRPVPGSFFMTVDYRLPAGGSVVGAPEKR